MSRLPDHLPPPAIIETFTRYECPECGTTCQCGKPYVPKTVRAAEYAAKNPTASVREIAKETGASVGTAHAAKAGVQTEHLTTGRDGKSYPATKPPSFKPPPKHYPSSPEDDGIIEEIVALLDRLSWDGRHRASKRILKRYDEWQRGEQ